jgi:hypothetical protein
MAKKKASMMGAHIPSEKEEQARRWCINNNIRISPSAVGAGTPARWVLVLDLNGKIVNAPDQVSRTEVWVKMYEYYMYYYKKSNQ